MADPAHSLVATVIAWGAKFSEHPLLVKDRERNRGQSQLAKTLINRTRDLAEDLKVHRVPNADHVVVALLIEPMQNREWRLARVPAARRYLTALFQNRKSGRFQRSVCIGDCAPTSSHNTRV